MATLPLQRGLCTSGLTLFNFHMVFCYSLAGRASVLCDFIQSSQQLVMWEVPHRQRRQAEEREETASVCVPALPPIPATMGMNTASAAHFAIVPWNQLTTHDARNAVARLIASHGNRRRND